jgi:hypothetical protein
MRRSRRSLRVAGVDHGGRFDEQGVVGCSSWRVPKLRPGCVLAPGLKALVEPRPRGPGSIVMRVRDGPTDELGVRTPTLRGAIMAQTRAKSAKTAAPRSSAAAKKSTKTAAPSPSAAAKKSTKTAAPRPSAAAKKSTSAELKRAAARTADLSETVLKSVETGQLAALDAVREFLDAVDEVLPAIGDRPSRRATVIDAALEMADKLVTTQYDFIRSVVRSADRTLNKPGSTKK